MLIDKLKTFPYRDKANEAYKKTEPYIIAWKRSIIIRLVLGCIFYIYDAFRNLIVKSRNEPFISLAAIATIVYAIFANRQLNVMQGQLNEMRAAAASDRGWLFITDVLTKSTTDNIKDKTIFKNIEFEIGNFGKAPPYGLP